MAQDWGGTRYVSLRRASRVAGGVPVSEPRSGFGLSGGTGPLLAAFIKVVGAIGFEPTTSWSQTRRSTKLSYTPTFAASR